MQDRMQRDAKLGCCMTDQYKVVATLFRLLDLRSGSITIDGLDIATIQREHVRHKLVGVSQESCIFGATVRFNLDPWGHASDEDMVAALRKVGLADTLLQRQDTLPFSPAGGATGLDVHMTAESLSQGQRQLFGLVRAILRPEKVVILDEPTSE